MEHSDVVRNLIHEWSCRDKKNTLPKIDITIIASESAEMAHPESENIRVYSSSQVESKFKHSDGRNE